MQYTGNGYNGIGYNGLSFNGIGQNEIGRIATTVSIEIFYTKVILFKRAHLFKFKKAAPREF